MGAGDPQHTTQKAEQQKNHDRIVESDTVARHGQGVDRKDFKTHFMDYSVNGLRKMILSSDPGTIATVGDHWKSVHKILSGGDGDGRSGAVDTQPAKGSIAGDLQKAVEDVLGHWEGQAAEAFKRRADEIGVSLRNGAAHANFTAEQLFAISKDLDAAKTQMEDIHEPSTLESAGDRMNDDGRDDAQAMKDLAAGVSAKTVAEANEKSLSLGMERKLQAVGVMETLAANYKVYATNLKSGGAYNEREGVAPPSNNVTMPPPITVPTPTSGGQSARRVANKPWSAGSTTNIKPAPTVAREPGITGGSQLPTTASELPAARTNVDSISPVTGTSPSAGVGGASVGAGGGLGAGGAQSAGIGQTGGTAGLAGGSVGGIGAVGGRGPAGGGAAAGRGAGGRAGTGGMGGLGAAGRSGASAGGRGALARARGGVVGAAKGVGGKGAGGGAGLHGSRGGTQRGGVAGAAGATGKGKRSGDENSGSDRPDYLVEDEETWISEEDRNRNVPRTIE